MVGTSRVEYFGEPKIVFGSASSSEDENESHNTLARAASRGVAQNAYQTLQSNNIFENKDFLAADEFLDADGTNDTVNTGTTTAKYTNGDVTYVLNYIDEASGDTTHDPDSFVNPGNAFDGNDTTFANKGVTISVATRLGKTFGAKNVGGCKVIVYKESPGSTTQNARLQTYNGSIWSDIANLFETTDPDNTQYEKFVIVNDNIQGIRVIFNNSSTGQTVSGRIYTLEYGAFNTSSFVQCDTGTLTLDGTEQAAIVYFDADIPVNTTLRADIGDGGTPIVGSDATKKISVVDMETLGSGTLDLKIQLSTTDTKISPAVRGYSIYLIY